MRIEKKTWPKDFQKVYEGKKTFDVRLADFECNEGDTLVLREWDPDTKSYTGRELEKEVRYVAKTKDFSYWSENDVQALGYQIIALQ